MNKSDLDQIQTIIKNAVKSLPTKEDLKSFATKDDLLALEKRFEQKFATKIDLETLKEELIEHIDTVEMNIIAVVEEHKADKTDLKVLEKRIRKIEDSIHAS